MDANEAATLDEAMSKAVKTVLDIDLTGKEFKGIRELNLDEMDKGSGGWIDEEGRDIHDYYKCDCGGDDIVYFYSGGIC